MKLKLSVFLFLISNSVLAAWANIYQAVLKHENFARKNIISIEQTAVYRCPGCYKLEVKITAGEETQVVECETKTTWNLNEIIVKCL